MSSGVLRGLLLGRANAADGGTAVGALTLGDGLAVLGGALHRILHDLLSLALDAICFNCHWFTSILYSRGLLASISAYALSNLAYYNVQGSSLCKRGPETAKLLLFVIRSLNCKLNRTHKDFLHTQPYACG